MKMRSINSMLLSIAALAMASRIGGMPKANSERADIHVPFGMGNKRRACRAVSRTPSTPLDFALTAAAEAKRGRKMAKRSINSDRRLMGTDVSRVFVGMRTRGETKGNVRLRSLPISLGAKLPPENAELQRLGVQCKLMPGDMLHVPAFNRREKRRLRVKFEQAKKNVAAQLARLADSETGAA